ncbi:nucleotidyltransferase family protein [Uliginosibacterium sp. 31-16]|uniref:N-acetylmuramate alpha-1-phosphate uridylyltransferase MurU n=1 Tax=Uliginosibacterium sp. 31-16 TaxID=3068315 RepID=UPI00273F7175|nr:nucleotidyltransferase family protein [Uliginosibacterium sp. 31-16]MDP5238214.1 nucleotidyltransferase family protein [Uliginosibacterium sp. 31-16]
MILAAGRGERMRPLTDLCPKPLLSVGGKPLIVWHIERLARAGIHEIVINHAHLGHKIEETLGRGAEWGVQIDYSAEDKALETAGGIANALPLLGDAPFLVVNGDVYCELDYGIFCARAVTRMTQGNLAHLALVDNPPHHPQGDFVLDASGRISRDGGSLLTFSGIGAYRPEMFRNIEPGSKARLAPLLFGAIDAGRLTGQHYQGRWEDVGTPERLSALDVELKTKA